MLKQDKKGKTSSTTSGLFGITQKKGGYYLDDGPGDNPPADLASIPDAVPRDEPLRQANMRPYVALGKSYTPMAGLGSYKARGIASWYGRRYHGQKTASGEAYDMYGMTAAHTILPIPSYARVTNIRNGKSVVVRVNDRGPFLSDRLIDLSYTAAYKLDVLGGGSAWVEVETILPGQSPALQIGEAPALVPISGSARNPATASTSSSIPASIPEKISPPQSLGIETQKGDAKLDLIETAYLPAQSGTSVSTSLDTPAIEESRGIYLQLGAFSVYDNADNFLARMRNELPSLINSLSIIARDGMFKVHAGPYADQIRARQAADRIAQTLYIKPVLLIR
uniref:septal ring lytic transglycosylase RlpA family protein n=1 Tax=Nitrosovibrio sp. Nv4 TaxID=1945880 RepID=UPI001F3375A2|nr:septal ring lytic transglycosylase RlpA family protein [Nitrosovibrio sp. Nv4]